MCSFIDLGFAVKGLVARLLLLVLVALLPGLAYQIYLDQTDRRKTACPRRC
jgi:hypothetical protein